ncbi:hypothetical protein NKR23_g6450 [Pleurostoma richardsiae]|uniref:C2H2-type domain-containing protein n=1 Tax=Pleurostoma richardsiae TaxID=41990 RepID=A0AA38VSN4_9PEZI|nr:hypothetical protein NKR23_g6450 [Pleurostoma richardsiae]
MTVGAAVTAPINQAANTPEYRVGSNSHRIRKQTRSRKMGQFICPACEERFARKDSLKRHQKETHIGPSVPYWCPHSECENSRSRPGFTGFKRREHLVQHQISVLITERSEELRPQEQQSVRDSSSGVVELLPPNSVLSNVIEDLKNQLDLCNARLATKEKECEQERDLRRRLALSITTLGGTPYADQAGL